MRRMITEEMDICQLLSSQSAQLRRRFLVSKLRIEKLRIRCEYLGTEDVDSHVQEHTNG